MAEKGKNATKALARALELNDPAPKAPLEDKLDKHGRAERAMEAWPPTARDLRAWMDVPGISTRTWPKRCAYPMVESCDFGSKAIRGAFPIPVGTR